MKETIVIFANSFKHGGHCVAGKSLGTKKWFRPVSDVNGGALNDQQIKYFNPMGRFSVKHLQNIEMEFAKKVPLLHQPENFLISNNPWHQKYNLDRRDIPGFLDHPETLWGEGDSVDSQAILNQHISIQQSLYLIKINQIELSLHFYSGSNHAKVSFVYNDKINYTLSCTDNNFQNLIKDNEIQTNKYLCISLGEEFKNKKHYKLVAAII